MRFFGGRGMGDRQSEPFRDVTVGGGLLIASRMVSRCVVSCGFNPLIAAQFRTRHARGVFCWITRLFVPKAMNCSARRQQVARFDAVHLPRPGGSRPFVSGRRPRFWADPALPGSELMPHGDRACLRLNRFHARLTRRRTPAAVVARALCRQGLAPPGNPSRRKRAQILGRFEIPAEAVRPLVDAAPKTSARAG